MPNRIFSVLFLFLAASCGAPKNASTSAPTDKSSGGLNLAGNWKITAMEMLNAPPELSDADKKQIVKNTLEASHIELKADSTFIDKGFEGTHTGRWRFEAATNTLYSDISEGGTDTFRVSTLTSKFLKGIVSTSDGGRANVELTRTQ